MQQLLHYYSYLLMLVGQAFKQLAVLTVINTDNEIGQDILLVSLSNQR